MAVIRTKSRIVYKRDEFGRFQYSCNRAASKTVQGLVDLGARTSRSMAPIGKRVGYTKRPGYVPLKRSIKSSRVGTGKRGYWYSTAPHAMFVEKGTAAHFISGKLYFKWKKGYFVWDNPYYGPRRTGQRAPMHSDVVARGSTKAAYKNWDLQTGAWVFHPGTKAQPFLEPAYNKVIKKVAMDYAKMNYPG